MGTRSSFTPRHGDLGGAPIADVHGWIVPRHILPNILAPLIVLAAFAIPNAIMLEAGLSFLGLGIQPPTASWGGMLQSNLSEIYGTPSLVITPTICIALDMLAFTFLGNGLGDPPAPRSS